MSNCLKLDAINGLANLEMLIRKDPTDQPRIDKLKFGYFGSLVRFASTLDMVAIFQHIATLKVKHLKLVNLDFFACNAPTPTQFILSELMLSHCSNFIYILRRIFLSHENLTSLTIKNHAFNHQTIGELAKLLQSNFRLRKIDYIHCAYVKGTLIETADEVVRRNQRMHDNCIDAVMTILLAQKSKINTNGFSYIGRDCTRIIGKYIVATKCSLDWLNCG